MGDESILYAGQGDTVDLLIWRERGLGAADLPAVLAANPGIAESGIVLPIGTPVRVPDAPPAAVTLPVINLWD